MLYTEFIEGTGCRDNDHNYKIYKQLELIYMNDESVTKSDIYEYGKKLVDNSKPQEVIDLENRILSDIESDKQQIKELTADIERMKEYVRNELDPLWRKSWQRDIRWRREDIRRLKRHIKGLKFVLNVG